SGGSGSGQNGTTGSAGTGTDLAGSFKSQSYDLLGITNGCTGFSNAVNGDLAGSSATPLDPKIGPLQNNGGPTLTIALLPTSPAIDQGSVSGLTTDQRGRPRPIDNPAIPNALGGDGSDI